MAVMLSTSLGDMVIDLHTESCPLACKNFLKLCKIKYYNNCLFHSVQKDFIAQTGDPTGTGKGGDSIYKFLYGEQARFFDDEIRPNLKHDKVGIVAMASAGENMNASQFYVTTREDLDYLDGKHTVFGEVAEGLDTLSRINEAYVDESNRPYKNIRVKTTCILDDPYDDPPGLAELIPDRSPEFRPEEGVDVRLEDDWVPMDEQKDPEEVEKIIREREAHSRAVVLEMIGDIPEAEVKPPENVLFVCKLNPVTQDEDLEVIFSRFGKVISADIIRDHKTGDSLCYGFIEFETQDACEAAYFKMDNVLIDDRRIHVDFSQSVSKLWNRYHRLGAKDDKEGVDKTKELPDKPRYQLKETDGQRGGTGKRYEMVFEDDNGTRTERSNKGADDRDFQSYKNDRSERSTDHERHINQRHEEGGRNYRGEREDINSHNRERGHDYRIKDERKRDMGDSRDREDEDSRDGRGREDSRDRRGREDSRDRRVREDSRDRRVREDSRDRKQVFRSSEDRQRDHRSYNSRDSRDRQGRDRTDREEKKQDNGEREDSKPEHRSERESRTDREEENGRRSEPGREYRGARSGGADGSHRKKSRTSNEGRQEDSRDGRRRG